MYRAVFSFQTIRNDGASGGAENPEKTVQTKNGRMARENENPDCIDTYTLRSSCPAVNGT
jgi:hypothetical protein